MKNSDAAALLKEICEVKRRRHRFFTEREVNFINSIAENINNGKQLGTSTGKELERIYRKSQGG